MADFRYVLNGKEVEAFQLTEDTRYQEKNWPEWMDSRYLMTIDGVEWLNINDVESEIPSLSWIVRHASGEIGVVDYSVMEAAEKVVIEVIEQPPEAEVDDEGLIKLAATMAGQTVEEFLEAREKKKVKSPRAISAAKVQDEDDREQQTAVDNDLLWGCRKIYQLLISGEQDDATGKLCKLISERADWCDCSPGACDGKSDMWDCRKNSPLVQ